MEEMDRRTGSPLVLIPGIQGRWEWMSPAVDALSVRHRVLTFSLNEVTGRSAFDGWMTHIDRLLDQAGHRQAALVGVSFGGLVAARYAARRPDRVSALVLVSPPAPGWRLDPKSATYVRRPVATLPLFAIRATGRLSREIVAALPTWRSRLSFGAVYLARALRWPASPRQMAAWVQEWMATDIASDCRRIAVPTLVVTGEPRLDRVVPVTGSLEYLRLIAGASHRTLPRTGHIGLVSKPREFAAIVDRFLADAAPEGSSAGEPPTSTLAEGLESPACS